MKLIYIKLVNFIGVKAAMGLNEIELKYDHIAQPIIQLFGKNRCGKTVMIQQHHPFSSINLTGDERNDLDLILPNEIGYKHVVYEVNGEVYIIKHTYKPSGKSHTVSTSFVYNNEELNPSGGVTTGNALIEKYLGINKYVFQFIINGTNLTSFSGMGATQRKQLLNKAMGIDIYDKIHKLATDDYRFTNKLITSLNHTKEYLLSTYGSYESLFATVDEKRSMRDKLEYQMQQTKTQYDQIAGKLHTILQQNPDYELQTVNQSIREYQSASERFGNVDLTNLPDILMNQQIQTNQQLSDQRASRTIVMKELDDLYDKQHKIDEMHRIYNQSFDDKSAMEQTIESLKEKINNMHSDPIVDDLSLDYLRNQLSIAQIINSTCKEIISALKHEHLELLIQMILHDIDVSAFLIKEGSQIIDSEKEKSVITYIRSMLNTVDGEIPDQTQCSIENCLYRRAYDAFDAYFQSFQSQTKGKFTQYDLEQMDHAYKNIQTIRRLLNTNTTDQTINGIFSMKSIMTNMLNHDYGIDVDFIKYMIEESAKKSQRIKYIEQLHSAEQSLSLIEERLKMNPTDTNDSITDIDHMISEKQSELQTIESTIQTLSIQLSEIDEKRLLLSNMKRIDIVALQKRKLQLEQILDQYASDQITRDRLLESYNEMQRSYQILVSELDTLEKAFDQYVKTSAEIEQNAMNDTKFKAIAEATSSTKGIPVIAIRDTVEHAIHTSNQLLDVMYDHEIELLHPIINETQFALPFRCGNNQSADIRYGSQSESTLLSLALSLSLASSLTSFNIPLVDEIDAYLDISIRDDFILMLEAMMSKLGMEQMFLISHNLQKGQFSHIVNTVDLSEIIAQSKS